MVRDLQFHAVKRILELELWTRVVYDGTNPPKPRPQRQWPPGINGEACELLFGGLTKLKERVMEDRKHLCKSFKFCLYRLAYLL